MKRITLLICLWVSLIQGISADNLTVAPVLFTESDTTALSIGLENTNTQWMSYQFILTLPAGVEVAKDGNGHFIGHLSSRQDESYGLTVFQQDDVHYSIVCFSAEGTPLSGSTGELLTLQLVANDSLQGKTRSASLSEVYFSEKTGEETALDNVSFDITVTAPVVVTANSYTIEYGDDLPSFGFTSEGATLEGAPSITCEATATSPVGTYPIVITKGSVTNYRDSYINGMLTITKAPLTITADNKTKLQGEALPTLTVSYSGFKNGETEAVLTTQPTVTTTATATSNPGDYPITVAGAEAQNYEITYVNGTLTVLLPDEVVVTANSYSREYGDPNPTFEYSSVGAELEGTPAITCEATATSPVGTYPIVITKGSVTNFNDSYVNGTLTITKAPLTISATSTYKKKGDQNPEFMVSYSGFKNGETEDVLTTKPSITCEATTDSPVGEYPIIVDGAEAVNYDITYVNGTLTILEVEAPIITINNNNVLTITSNTTGAIIYYTLDGSKPTVESTIYSEPVTLMQNCTVRAIAYNEELGASEESKLEVGGLTKILVLPTPVISHEENVVTITVPSLSEPVTDLTNAVEVSPSSWGGTAPTIDISGEWTCSLLDNDNNVTETYIVTLKEGGKAEFPSSYLEESSWSYSNGSLRIRHDILYTQNGSYNYQEYQLETATPDNPLEFTGKRRSIVGNWITENVNERNVIFTYNGTAFPVLSVKTDDNRESVVAIADEGNDERTGSLLQQTITGLENGYYTIELFAKSVYSSAQSMATDVTYLYANGMQLFIPLEADKEIHEHNIYLIGVDVTDGTIHLGLGKERTGANWHALQIKSLKRHTLTTSQPIEGTAIYYTTDDSTPTTASTSYTNPFALPEKCTIKAIAVAEGYAVSGIASFFVEWLSDPEPYAVLSDNNTVLTFYYDAQKSVRGGMSVGPFNHNDERGWHNERESIMTVVFDESFANCLMLTSTADWFAGFKNLNTIVGISNLKTDNVTSMYGMFVNCSNLLTLDLSSINTSNVTDMSYLFAGCTGLTSLDVSRFSTDNVESMAMMFYCCYDLTDINLSSFRTNKVTNMSSMFSGCFNLANIDVSGFITDNVTDMNGMFLSCSSLTNLDVSGFKTDNVTNMTLLFNNCPALTTLDISNFKTDKVTNMSYMFGKCTNLTTIYVGDEWTTSNVAEGDGLFTDCTNLVGGAGTVFDPDHVDVSYAHIDGGPSNPGYFTDIHPQTDYTFVVDGMTFTIPDPEVPVTSLIACVDKTVVTIPSSVSYLNQQWTVTEIADSAFYNHSELVTVSVPTSVTTVGENVFARCPHLAAITWEAPLKMTSAMMGNVNNPNLLLYVTETPNALDGVTNVIDLNTKRAARIVLSDASSRNDFYCPTAFTADEISYTHRYSQQTEDGTCRGWEAIALPFNVSRINHHVKGAITPFGALERGHELDNGTRPFWLYEFTTAGLFSEAASIRANVPYIISMPNESSLSEYYVLKGDVTFSATNATVVETAAATGVTSGDHRFLPNYRSESSTELYLLNVGQEFEGHVEGSVFALNPARAAHPFEACFDLGPDTGVKSCFRVFDGTNGVQLPSISPQGGRTPLPNRGEALYDLSGRRVTSKSSSFNQIPSGVYIQQGKKVLIR
ncbi:MAG: BspA family leucine-rich repeat surface protein [Bacteroidaceae bacterium]|nr:BspA family leucine-rich repeat surface protein [Bacteroidaceae bacterium]